MANPDIRMMYFYFGSKLAAKVHQVDYTINPGRTAAYGMEGYLAHSKGAVRCTFTLNEVTPTSGSTFSELWQKILNQEDVDCGIDIAGKQHRVTLAITSVNFKSSSESGMSDGTMTLEGGLPQVTG